MKPVSIVGGGLAGLALGHALLGRGVPVRIDEAGGYPRHRVCGEFLSGLDDATIAALELAPLLSDAPRHQTVAWFCREQLGRTDRLPRPAFGISRHALDARLARRFRERGGTLQTGLRVPAGSPVAGRVWAAGRRRAGSTWLGLKMHVRDLQPAADLELHLGDGAYVGLAQVETGAFNVCGLFRRRREAEGKREALFFAYLRLAGLHDLARRVASAPRVEGSFCAVAALGFARAPQAPPGEIALGDALGMIPPFTGDGMAMALQGAVAIGDPLSEYASDRQSWPETVQGARRALSRRFRRRFAAAAFAHPFLLHRRAQGLLTLVHRAGLLPFAACFRALHE